jgi:hypothetical protein
MSEIAAFYKRRNRLRQRVQAISPLLERSLFSKGMPMRHAPSPGDLETLRQNGKDYCTNLVHYIQHQQEDKDLEAISVHLTYFPIAKNMRLVGTALFRALNTGKRIALTSGNPQEEELLLKWLKTEWKPWLWSRIPRGQLSAMETHEDDVHSGWSTYFTRVCGEAPATISSPSTTPRLPGKSRKNAILQMACCTSFACTLNQDVLQTIKPWEDSIDWPENEEVLGIHIRRGDAASEDLTKSTRTSNILEEYLSNADELCQKYNIKTLYLSTESELEVQRAQKLRPQYRILSLPHDRNIFPQIADSNEFIERRSLRDPSCIEALVTSALADLHFLARCSGFIGTFNSEFSVLAWLLCIAENKHLVPYINMTPRNALAYNQSNLEFWPS